MGKAEASLPAFLKREQEREPAPASRIGVSHLTCVHVPAVRIIRLGGLQPPIPPSGLFVISDIPGRTQGRGTHSGE